MFKKILQILGVLFIISIVLGIGVFYFAKKEIKNANDYCITKTRTKLQDLMVGGTKDSQGKIWVNDPNIASVDKFKAEIENYYNVCMENRGIPEVFRAKP